MPSFVLSQNKEARLVQEIRNAYDKIKYTEAETKAQAALKEYQRFTPAQLTEIHKILALIYYSQNNAVAAKEHFENALSLNPDLTLDPLFVSPKILDYFNQLKLTWQLKSKRDSETGSEVRYLLVQDRRPVAAFRSMILPGWGQIYKGEKRKGLVLSTLWGVGIAGSVVTHLARESAENKYLSETNPSTIQSRYHTFNTLHKLRNNFLIFSAGVWIYSYLDAILKESPNKIQTSSENVFLIFPSISSKHANLTILMNF
ncbi:MAG: hypothetical protein ACE5HI_15310 [bacterium]